MSDRSSQANSPRKKKKDREKRRRARIIMQNPDNPNDNEYDSTSTQSSAAESVHSTHSRTTRYDHKALSVMSMSDTQPSINVANPSLTVTESLHGFVSDYAITNPSCSSHATHRSQNISQTTTPTTSFERELHKITYDTTSPFINTHTTTTTTLTTTTVTTKLNTTTTTAHTVTAMVHSTPMSSMILASRPSSSPIRDVEMTSDSKDATTDKDGFEKPKNRTKKPKQSARQTNFDEIQVISQTPTNSQTLKQTDRDHSTRKPSAKRPRNDTTHSTQPSTSHSTSRPASPIQQTAPTSPIIAPKRPPPIHIYTSKHTDIIRLVNSQINPTPAFKFNNNSLICHPPSSKVHGKIINILNHHKIEHYTFSPADDRPIKIILKYVPTSTTDAELEADFRSKSLPFLHIARIMLPDKTITDGAPQRRTPANIVLVTIPKEAADAWYSMTETCSMRVTVAEYVRSGIPQCHNCQRYGHSSELCRRIKRCVRCGGTHRDGLPSGALQMR